MHYSVRESEKTFDEINLVDDPLLFYIMMEIE